MFCRLENRSAFQEDRMLLRVVLVGYFFLWGVSLLIQP